MKAPSINAALGTNHFRKAKAVVFCLPKVYQEDRAAARFVLKHETAHIKHNDSLIECLVRGVAHLAAAVYAIAKMKFFPGLILSYLVSTNVWVACRRLQEIRADNFAIQQASDEELLGGRRYFKAAQQENLSLRVSDVDKLCYSST